MCRWCLRIECVEDIDVHRFKLEETGQGGKLNMESRYLEISLVGQEQTKTMGLPGQSCLWIFGKRNRPCGVRELQGRRLWRQDRQMR